MIFPIVLVVGGNALLPDPDSLDEQDARNEATRNRIPLEILDVLVAETQGSIGYLISRSLHNAMTDGGEVR